MSNSGLSKTVQLGVSLQIRLILLEVVFCQAKHAIVQYKLQTHWAVKPILLPLMLTLDSYTLYVLHQIRLCVA